MDNIRDNPERFGLEIVGEVEWTYESYDFDLTVVFRDKKTGDLFYGDDSGCSYPRPFSGMGMDDLVSANRHEVLAHLAQRQAGEYSRPGTSAEMIERINAL